MMTDWYQKSMNALALNGKAGRTQEAYSRALRMLCEFHGGKSPEEISEAELETYFLHRRNVDHWSANTLRPCYGGRRFVFDYASRDELLACLDHQLAAAGNPSLMTPELKATLADHAAGNYRVLMNLADELLTAADERELPRLDEKLYFDVFGQTQKPKPARKR